MQLFLRLHSFPVHGVKKRIEDILVDPLVLFFQIILNLGSVKKSTLLKINQIELVLDLFESNFIEKILPMLEMSLFLLVQFYGVVHVRRLAGDVFKTRKLCL